MTGRSKGATAAVQTSRVPPPPFQNEKLSRNETQMDGERSLWLARALRNATRHAGALFGNDVRTAYQLLGRVLLHESGRQGFELAATRDARFHEVRPRSREPSGRPRRPRTRPGPGVPRGRRAARVCPQPFRVAAPSIPRAKLHFPRRSRHGGP